MKAVIYARYSSHKQTEQSIEGQLRDCYAYAKKNNITVIGEYIDRALSAKTDDRPQFKKIIEDSKKRLFDTVLVWKLDRFARNRFDSSHYKNILKKNGVKVISAMEDISDNPEGILIESLLEGMAEYYSAELSQKVNRGMRESAMKCQSTGGTFPLGYKVGPDKTFIIDEKTAPIVKEVFGMYAAGKTITEIYTDLNKRGIQTFGRNSFKRMLSNKKYIGIYKYKDIEIENGMPKIIDIELFEKVQKMLKENRKTGARKKAAAEYLLTSKLFCGHCLSPMTGESGKSKNGSIYYYYKCAEKKKKASACQKKAVRKEYIEDFVIDSIYEKIITKDDVIDKIALMFEEAQKEMLSDTSLCEAFEFQLKETQKSINNIMFAIEQGIFTSSTKDRLLELETKRDNLIVEIEKNRNKKIHSKESVAFFLKQFQNADTNDIDNRKMLIKAFVNKIYLYDDNRLLIIYNLTDMPEDDINIEPEAFLEAFECSDIGSLASPEKTTVIDRLPSFFQLNSPCGELNVLTHAKLLRAKLPFGSYKANLI